MKSYPGFPIGNGDVEDLFVCKSCNAEGKAPHIDVDSSHGSDQCDDDWGEADDELHRSVQSYGSIYVGKAMEGGKVGEIYPGLDKFTVATQQGEVRHYLLSLEPQEVSSSSR